MINIRLQRRGRKNDPSYRVIVVDSRRKPKAGNYLEMVGSYDPRTDRIELNGERILHWIKNGAQPSATVHNLLVSNKIIDAKKINILPAYKTPAQAAAAEVAQEAAQEEVAAPAEEASAPVEEKSAEPVSNEVVEEAPKE